MSSEKKPKKEKEILLEFENQARGKSQILRNVDKQDEFRLSRERPTSWYMELSFETPVV